MSTTPHVPDPLEGTDPARFPLGELHAMLREGARGVYTTEAAIELLIAHDHWLRRRDFLTRCVVAWDRWLETLGPMAVIDWNAVAESIHPARSLQPDEGLAGSSSEIAVLALAASLAGKPSRLSLQELLAPLSRANIRLVSQAVAHTGGSGGADR